MLGLPLAFILSQDQTLHCMFFLDSLKVMTRSGLFLTWLFYIFILMISPLFTNLKPFLFRLRVQKYKVFLNWQNIFKLFLKIFLNHSFSTKKTSTLLKYPSMVIQTAKIEKLNITTQILLKVFCNNSNNLLIYKAKNLRLISYLPVRRVFLPVFRNSFWWFFINKTYVLASWNQEIIIQ